MKTALENIGLGLATFVVWFGCLLLASACQPEPEATPAATPVPTPTIVGDAPATTGPVMVDEEFPTPVPPPPVPTDDVVVSTPEPGEADCGGLRPTLDFLDSPYTIVESTVGPVCIEDDLGVYLSVNSNVSCETAIEADVPTQVGYPDASIYGCEDYTP